MSARRTYTVIGIYKSPEGQRWADTVVASSPESAENKAMHALMVDMGLDPIFDNRPIWVAAVVEGPCLIVG